MSATGYRRWVVRNGGIHALGLSEAYYTMMGGVFGEEGVRLGLRGGVTPRLWVFEVAAVEEDAEVADA